MNLIPLADRVLIKPAGRPEKTESGLWLSEHRKPDTQGWVRFMGDGCWQHPRKQELEHAANVLEKSYGTVEQDTSNPIDVKPIVELLRSLIGKEPQARVGDFAVFSWQSGQEFWMDDERLLIMRESDLLAVVEEDVTHG